MAAKKAGRPAKTTKPAGAKVVSLERQLKQRARTKHRGEIIAICAVAAAVLLGIGIYTDGGGVAGQAVDGILKGLFGVGALVVPVAAAWLGITMILKDFKLPDGVKVYLSAALFFCAITLAHIITSTGEAGHEGLTAYIAAGFKAGSAQNGGLFGAVIGDLFLKVLGGAGSYIAIFALAMVLIILLTDKSIVQGVIGGVNKAKTLRPPRRVRYEDEYEDEPPQAPIVPVARNPKKATVTINEREAGERPKILMYNEIAKPETERPRSLRPRSLRPRSRVSRWRSRSLCRV